VSAVDAFWPIHQALGRLERERNIDADPLLDRWGIAYPLSIGVVQAGDWASSVPDVLVADGRLGVALDESLADARRSLEAAVAEASADDPWLRDHPAEVEWWGGQFGSCRLSPDSDLDDVVCRAHDRAAAGRALVTWAAPFGSDLRLFGAAGIPAVHYGPGRIEQAHAADEHVAVDDVRVAAGVLALAAIDVCGVA
jgi:acetylornithine deacetylase